MAPELRVIAVTGASGHVTERDCLEWLAKAESVHRQLRPQLPADYLSRMREVFANGARMAVVVAGEAVVCVALWLSLIHI